VVPSLRGRRARQRYHGIELEPSFLLEPAERRKGPEKGTGAIFRKRDFEELNGGRSARFVCLWHKADIS
jgi:hypothetical protein